MDSKIIREIEGIIGKEERIGVGGGAQVLLIRRAYRGDRP